MVLEPSTRITAAQEAIISEAAQGTSLPDAHRPTHADDLRAVTHALHRAFRQPTLDSRLAVLLEETRGLTGAGYAAVSLRDQGTIAFSGADAGSHGLDIPLDAGRPDIVGLLSLRALTPLAPGAATVAELVGAFAAAAIAECRACESLAEAEGETERLHALLREANHRITNNISSVAALLQMQARSEDSPEVQNVLLEAVGRVQTFGRIHESLYRTGNVETIDISDHLSGLLTEVAANGWCTDGAPPSVALDCPPLSRLPTAVATPLSLIAVELVMNALKHAAIPDRALRIAVTFDPSDPLSLTVADNGPGFPSGRPKGKHSFGLTLVEALSGQLGGTVMFGQAPGGTGAAVTVRFPGPVG